MTLQQTVVSWTRKDRLGAGGLAFLAGVGVIAIGVVAAMVLSAPSRNA